MTDSYSEDLLEACAKALVLESYDDVDLELAFAVKADLLRCGSVSTPEHILDWFLCLRPEDYRRAVLGVIERLESLTLPKYPGWEDYPDASYYESMITQAQRVVAQADVCLYAAMVSHYRAETLKVYHELAGRLFEAKERTLRNTPPC